MFDGQLHFDWMRFWIPRGESCTLADDGFLLDPTARAGMLFGSSALPFQKIDSYPCLALLGEPGSGKSEAMTDIITSSAVGPNPTRVFDLKSYGSEERFVRELTSDPLFRAWADKGEPLHLYIDSLDECLLRVATVTDILVHELRSHSSRLNDLRLRIMCRAAEWPFGFEGDLKSIFGKKLFAAYEIAPLTRSNVKYAATGYGVDPERFQDELRRVNGVPFAVRPVTLHFLLRIFKRDGRLPRTQDELYSEGCMLLCDEPNMSRRDRRVFGQLSPSRRLKIAQRIAAVTIFCNRAAILDGMEIPQDQDAVIRLAELAGGIEKLADDTFAVGEPELREVLATALFTSRGPQQWGWAHQTYAEFLAAVYLHDHHAELKQVMSLIEHPDDEDGRIVPQLAETSAWLTGRFPPLRQELIRRDPSVLLRSDVATADEETRTQLVKALLSHLERGELIDWQPGFTRNYSKLRHSQLHLQLLPYLSDRTKNFRERKFAIDVIKATDTKLLLPELCKTALDPSEDHLIRCHAARAVAEIGSGADCLALFPLARGEAGDDPDDDLMGSALTALWPRYISAEELFKIIHYPKRPNVYAMYSSFLHRDLMKNLSLDQLPVALKWVAQQRYEHNALDPMIRLGDEIIAKAWDESVPGTPLWRQLAKVILTRLKQHARIIRRKTPASAEVLWTGSDQRRRDLLRTLVPLANEFEYEPDHFLFIEPPLAVPHDIPWMLSVIQNPLSQNERNAWIQLIARAFCMRFDHLDDILAAMADRDLAKVFGPLFAPVEINSATADECRARLEDQKKLFKHEQPVIERGVAARELEDRLRHCEDGAIGDWWLVAEALGYTDEDLSHNWFTEDLRTLPGWKSASLATQKRILITARQYLSSEEPSSEDWFGTNTLLYPAAAGYNAMLLLQLEAPDVFAAIPPQTWEKWASAIIGFPDSSGKDGYDGHESLVTLLYAKAPGKVVQLFLKLVKSARSTLFDFSVLAGCWDDHFVEAVTNELRHGELANEASLTLLIELIRYGGNRSMEFAAKELAVPVPADEAGHCRCRAIATALIEYSLKEAWPILWQTITSEPAWGKELFLAAGPWLDRNGGQFGEDLTASQLAELYEWLQNQFPPEHDPKDYSLEMHKLEAREVIAGFRDSLLRELAARGTPEAMNAMSGLAALFPTKKFIRSLLFSSRLQSLQRTWKPPTPQQILSLVRHPRSRLVQNGGHLQDLLVESLRRWEAKLQGTPPAAFQLWEQSPRNRPKEEERLSDAIALHLKDDLVGRGIAVNREVVIRPRLKGGSKGERTDIQVDATPLDADASAEEVITVTIEVKGCWHTDLMTAAQSQLVGRYLTDTSTKHGLYVVGWFLCDAWNDPKDRRRAKTPKKSIDQIQLFLDDEAALASDGPIKVRAVVINTSLR